MDRQVAYDLFSEFLCKINVKEIDVRKELTGFLAYGYAKGVFVNPHAVHELTEWRKFGDILCEAIIEDDKTAKEMGKLWRVVHDALLQHVTEKKAAGKAIEAHKRNLGHGELGESFAPAVNEVIMPRPMGLGQECGDPVIPSAPLVNEVGESLPVSKTAGAESPVSAGALSPPPPEPPECAKSQSSRSSSEPDSIPGALSDLWGGMARQRKETWAALAEEAMDTGDGKVLEAVRMACPVIYTPVVDQNGQYVADQGDYVSLDWKMLSQLRATVAQFGVKSEPVGQMLDCMFNTMLLLPNDMRGLVRLILTQHQQLLFNAHWQTLVNESVAVQRGPGDRLAGVTMDELMGLGPFLRTEAQVTIGADKIREAMRLVRLAIDRVKEPGGVPAYMSIKQGRDESFGSFIDKAAAAIDRAGVPEYMKGALLKQCALQNSNPATQSVLANLGANWTIEEALERMALQPTGSQAFLVEAFKELRLGMQKQAGSSQKQVLAALAPLQASAIVTNSEGDRKLPVKCYRCGRGGRMRFNCRATGV
ncbi:hypothetical protein ASZ78_012444 [Callipepla squamata]|uniref:Retroviral nucleocapsid Gag protein p24 C-terminal domain-containing protein n=1 Tax=Callipepla squamata TaxID=9009 RepID=A0A226NEX2_CALSU|nr:hypothetical protein ASZ78_012444 [Callipepla squamata]